MKTILIVDDEEEIRTMVFFALKNPGYRILETADGKTALELAKREKPDLVVLDWMMPRMTGIEVASALREDPVTAEVPIIMLTGVNEERRRQQAYDLKVLSYIAKPFSLLELREKVRILLE